MPWHGRASGGLNVLVLHDYWRSGAAYRVRIALALKGLEYESVPHDLLSSEQRSDRYRAINPQGLVPALDTGSAILTQSMAIIEWLDERYPAPALLPADPDERAAVRAMAMAVACDIHPLGNLRVLQAIDELVPGRESLRSEWIGRWVRDGFAAIEQMLANTAGLYAFGKQPSLADCCLVPQAYSAERFGIALDAWPVLARVISTARANPAFAAAHPDRHLPA